MRPDHKSEQPSLSLPGAPLETSGLESEVSRPELDYQIPKPPGSALPGSSSLATGVAPVLPGGANPNPINAQIALPATDNAALGRLPHAAGDIDLMEKEWMIKAKHILAKNRNSPHQQSVEINLLKAAYLKKRFNKDLKIADG